MPSTKVHPPARYPAHWHACLRWLAAQPQAKPAQIELLDSTDPMLSHRCSVETWKNKLQAMRESVRQYPGGWDPEIRRLVASGELRFEARGTKIFAVRRPGISSFVNLKGVLSHD